MDVVRPFSQRPLVCSVPTSDLRLSLCSALSYLTLFSTQTLSPPIKEVHQEPVFYGRSSHASGYFCGDPRFGPEELPTSLPLFSHYKRFGGLGPKTFLEKWYSASADCYIYPPADGFQLSSSGMIIAETMTLLPGTRMDRFGPEQGTFLAPLGTPFHQRSLPPQSLNAGPHYDRHPYNYHLYEVEKPLTALSGPIADWFGQPGQGVQYQAPDTVETLVEDGFLNRLHLDVHRERTATLL